MDMLITFALKSVLIAGVTLGLLQLLKGRSASERSMVAHLGLLVLVLFPFGSMFLPQLVVSAPLFDQAPTALANLPAGPIAASPAVPVVDPYPAVDPTQWWPLVYGIPVLLLLGITLLAVLRLLALRAKASVLVEPSWLSALAHAQRRMDFKHGTALLTSSELKSPISWGVLRPVILLNDEALAADDEAEAIIAHELAHVRGLDWAKLLLGRIATALFWFNPLVWTLAREAHQLREETADDAVLAADVASADYAQLLVGVARHECRGLLLGAHGVAPGKGSLTRRVRRVLDGSVPRTPIGRGFAAGLILGVIGAAAPLAAVTVGPRPVEGSPAPLALVAASPADSLPSLVARSVAQATATTTQAVSVAVAGEELAEAGRGAVENGLAAADVATKMAMAHPHPGPKPYPAPTVRSPGSAADQAIERAIGHRAIGITADYAAGIRAALPGISVDDDELVGLRAVGVTPEWIRAMSNAGYGTRDIDDLTGARAVGVSPGYVAELSAAGLRGLSLSDLTAMRALGINGASIRRLRAAGYTDLTADRMIELRASGWDRHATGDPPDVPEPPEPPEDDGE